MLLEIRDMGFEYAELSHGIRISLLPGIFQAVDAGEIKISTLHNFCPLPMGINHAAPNIYQFSSTDEREWENAYRHSIKTLETAVRVKAKLVVLHMGSIDMKEYTDKLIEMVAAGQKDSSKYMKLCEEVEMKRLEKKKRYTDRAYAMLKRLVPQAESRGILLGVENREALEEIPLDGDYFFFWREFPQTVVGYWHDTGHAQIKENLGFLHHRMHLEANSSRLLGFHIHDVAFPGKDHCAPGTGTIDFSALKDLVKPDHIKVFEFSPSMTPEEARKGIEHIKQIWGAE